MEILKGALVVLHLVGFAAVLGGALAQLPRAQKDAARISSGILHGCSLLFATGIFLVAMLYGTGEEPNNAKIGAKMLVLLSMIAIVLLNRKREHVSGGVLGAIAGLAIVNVALAVLW